MPEDCQLVVLTAAAEPLGDPVLLHGAARALGLDLAAAVPAVQAGLQATMIAITVRSIGSRASAPVRRAAASWRVLIVCQVRSSQSTLAGTVRPRQPIHPVEDGAAELVQRGVRELHLRLHADRAQHRAASSTSGHRGEPRRR